jgi:cobalt-zinc-cadmium efflux system membrane fusion protein
VTKLSFAIALMALSVTGCPSGKHQAEEKPSKMVDPKPAESAGHRDEPEHTALPKHIRLDPQVVADAGIKTAPVVREALVATIDLPGEVASDPDKTARVSALAAGRLETVSFKEGQFVKKGDVLAVIKVPDLARAKAGYAATAAKAVAARSNATRLRELAEKRLAADQEVLAAGAEADALEAEARAAEVQLRALGAGVSGSVNGAQLQLRAPVAGTIVSRDAVVGQSVTSDQAIAIIADLAEVWFLARVFEKNLDQVHVGADAEVRLNAHAKEHFEGKIEYVGKQIDPTARTVVARIRLANREELLRLGLFGIARVATGLPAERPATLVVPRSAVSEIGNKPIVFVRQSDGDFELHDVVLGDGALGKVEIVSGLREGEQVVVDGVFTLKSAVLKGTFGGEEE